MSSLMSPRALNIVRSALARGQRVRSHHPSTPSTLTCSWGFQSQPHPHSQQPRSLATLAAASHQHHYHHQHQQQDQTWKIWASGAAGLGVVSTLAAVGISTQHQQQQQHQQSPFGSRFNETSQTQQVSKKEVSSGPHKFVLSAEDRRQQQAETLYDKYKVDWDDPILGKGAFGSVHLCYEKTSMEPVALKRLSLQRTNIESFLTEVEAMKRIQQHGGHKHILALRDLYQDSENFYVLLDAARGGELYEDLAENGSYTPAQAARLIAQLASALDFLHQDLGMVHADLKPENLLLTNVDRTQADVALIDFGCAVCKKDAQQQQQQSPANGGKDNVVSNTSRNNIIDDATKPVSCNSGTLAYWPPERFGDDVVPTPAMDMWSVGIILYILLIGAHPFDLKGVASNDELEQAIVSCKEAPELFLSLMKRNNDNNSNSSNSDDDDDDAENNVVADLADAEQAQDLINQLLAVDPDQRPTAKQVLQHPWIVKQLHQQDQQQEQQQPQIITPPRAKIERGDNDNCNNMILMEAAGI